MYCDPRVLHVLTHAFPIRRSADLNGAAETPDGDDLEGALGRQIALLWQTRALRLERLYVADEVENAVSFMRDSFLPAIPRLYAGWEKELRHRPESFLTIGSWIGGDRDGNPYVPAESLCLALAQPARAVLAFYLAQIHALVAALAHPAGLAPIPYKLFSLREPH